MKTVRFGGLCMTRSVVLTEEEKWYVAQDVLSGVASQGHTVEEALNNLREALELFFEGNPEAKDETVKTVMLTTLEVAV